MAPSKAKGQKMGLGEFLTDTTLGSWADEMEDAPIPSASRYGGDRPNHTTSSGAFNQADRAYPVRESLPLPTKPPYTVHLGNMSFDATEGDIQELFADCQVTSIRIVEDRIDRKPKGFGYAEFASLEGLKKALEHNGATFQGRNIRVSVAEPQKDRPEARDISDWTRKGPLPDLSAKRVPEKPAFGSRGPDFSNDHTQDRPNRRQLSEQTDGKTRDFSNWERKGPLGPQPGPTVQSSSRISDRPPSHDGTRDRRTSPAWGEGRSQDGSRPPKRDFVDRLGPERVPSAAELDNQWRSKMRPDPIVSTNPAPQPQAPRGLPNSTSTVTSPAAASTHVQPATRPKLNLQKRTVSQSETSSSPVTTSSDLKASPFGAARPIDTSARDKEIEEKMRQKKEQEERARDEKHNSDEKVKEEKRTVKEAEKAEKNRDTARDQPKTEDALKRGEMTSKAGPSTGKNYQILRRDIDDAENTHENTNDGNILTVNGNVNKISDNIHDDKGINSNGVSREETSVRQDEDGWSTVRVSSKNRKAGMGAARTPAA